MIPNTVAFKIAVLTSTVVTSSNNMTIYSVGKSRAFPEPSVAVLREHPVRSISLPFFNIPFGPT